VLFNVDPVAPLRFAPGSACGHPNLDAAMKSFSREILHLFILSKVRVEFSECMAQTLLPIRPKL